MKLFAIVVAVWLTYIVYQADWHQDCRNPTPTKQKVIL